MEEQSIHNVNITLDQKLTNLEGAYNYQQSLINNLTDTINRLKLIENKDRFTNIEKQLEIANGRIAILTDEIRSKKLYINEILSKLNPLNMNKKVQNFLMGNIALILFCAGMNYSVGDKRSFYSMFKETLVKKILLPVNGIVLFFHLSNS